MSINKVRYTLDGEVECLNCYSIHEDGGAYCQTCGIKYEGQVETDRQYYSDIPIPEYKWEVQVDLSKPEFLMGKYLIEKFETPQQALGYYRQWQDHPNRVKIKLIQTSTNKVIQEKY